MNTDEHGFMNRSPLARPVRGCELQASRPAGLRASSAPLTSKHWSDAWALLYALKAVQRDILRARALKESGV